MRGPSRRTRSRPQVAAVLVGILLGATLVVWATPPVAHRYVAAPLATCVPGELVETLNETLTPLALMNSPYHGSATGSLPITNGTRHMTLFPSNGSVVGYFEIVGWTVRSGESQGPANASCASRLFLQYQDHETSDTFSLYNQTYNFTNDSQAPTSENVSWTAAPVYFSDGVDRHTEAISTCGGRAVVRNATSSHLTVGVPVPTPSGLQTLDYVLNISTSYTYTFPANGGEWEVDNLSAPGGPGGGWAFSYSPCP
jgi:hypothetical protein